MIRKFLAKSFFCPFFSCHTFSASVILFMSNWIIYNYKKCKKKKKIFCYLTLTSRALYLRIITVIMERKKNKNTKKWDLILLIFLNWFRKFLNVRIQQRVEFFWHPRSQVMSKVALEPASVFLRRWLFRVLCGKNSDIFFIFRDILRHYLSMQTFLQF